MSKFEFPCSQGIISNGVTYHLDNDTLQVKGGDEPLDERDLKSVCLRSSLYIKGDISFSKYRWNLYGLSDQAFKGRLLEKIIFPCTVERIEDSCFSQCKSLTEIIFEFGSRLRSIGGCAFKQTSLRSVYIPASVEFIGKHCFERCTSLCEITFESGSKLKRIEEYAFWETRVRQIQIPSSVEFIGKHCFERCTSLCEITFESGSSLKEIGDYAFYETILKKIELPAKCEIISAFSLAGVKTVSICRENPFLIEEESFIKIRNKKVLIQYNGADLKIIIDQEVEGKFPTTIEKTVALYLSMTYSSE
jgi:hypothetical protein